MYEGGSGVLHKDLLFYFFLDKVNILRWLVNTYLDLFDTNRSQKLQFCFTILIESGELFDWLWIVYTMRQWLDWKETNKITLVIFYCTFFLVKIII